MLDLLRTPTAPASAPAAEDVVPAVVVLDELVRLELQDLVQVTARVRAALASARAVRTRPSTVRIRHSFRRLWPHLRRDRRRLLAVAVLSAVAPLLAAANIWLFQRVVDNVLVPADTAPLPGLVGVLLALAAATAFVTYLGSIVAASVGLRVVNRLRTTLFRHLLGLPVSFFERRAPGDLLARLGPDVASTEAFAAAAVTVVVTAAVTLTTSIVLLARLSWRLLLFALVAGPLVLGATRLFAAGLQRRAAAQAEREGELIATAEELLGNVPVLQSFGAEELAADRFDDATDRARRADLATVRLGAAIGPTIGLLEAGGGIALLWLGSREIAAGRLTPGGLLVFLTLVTQVFGPVKNLGGLLSTLAGASAGAERVLAVLAEPPAAVRLGGADVPLPADGPLHRGVLHVDDVWFAHDDTDEPTLRGVTLTVRPGELVVLVGPSGAGKSTLVRLLRRFDDPQRGRILLDGVDIRTLRPDAYRRMLTTTFQQPALFDGTIAANLRLARPTADEAVLWAALADADLAEFVRSLPDGLATRLGPRGGLLSGGQAQRLALARALVRSAPVVVADEPTTGLDGVAAASVVRTLRRLARHHAVLVVSHSPEVAAHAHRVVVLDGGRVVADGTHRTLLAMAQPYREAMAGGAGDGALHTPAAEPVAARPPARHVHRGVRPPLRPVPRLAEAAVAPDPGERVHDRDGVPAVVPVPPPVAAPPGAWLGVALAAAFDGDHRRSAG